MHKKLEKQLEQKYGWLKLGEVRGVVKAESGNPTEKSNGLNLGVLPPNYEFSKSKKVTINLSESTKLTKLFIRLIGPEIIYATKHFLEEAFYNLLIDVSIGKERQKVPVVEIGKLNRRQMILMGEIKDWIMYYWIEWNTLRFDYADAIPVNLLVHGKTGRPRVRDIDFILQLYVKMETL